MAELARQELRGAEHPPVRRLVAYHRGELPPAETAAMTEHLSLCTECSALLLDAAEFFAGDEEEPEPADLEASWQALQEAARGATKRPVAAIPAPPAPRSIPRRPILRSLPFAYGLAACFAALSVALLVVRPPSAPLQPHVNDGLYDLTSTSQRGEGSRETPIRFQGPGSSAYLILNPAAPPGSPRYGLRLRSADGRVAWRSEGLKLETTLGPFHVSLPAGAFPPGRYSLELYGLDAGRETPLGTFRIVLER
jgi:hypothetical protein